jgi:hypothetical protein
MTRRRWVYTEGGRPLPEPVEVGEDFRNTPGYVAPFTDAYMDGAVATDGTDISSRRKREAYMKANNLADLSDFTQHLEKAAKQREAVFTGQHDREARREALGRALHRHTNGRKR